MQCCCSCAAQAQYRVVYQAIMHYIDMLTLRAKASGQTKQPDLYENLAGVQVTAAVPARPAAGSVSALPKPALRASASQGGMVAPSYNMGAASAASTAPRCRTPARDAQTYVFRRPTDKK